MPKKKTRIRLPYRHSCPICSQPVAGTGLSLCPPCTATPEEERVGWAEKLEIVELTREPEDRRIRKNIGIETIYVLVPERRIEHV